MYSVVGSDGQVYGPVDMATLSQWIAEGRVTPTTNLIDPIDGRVIQAGHAPALMGNFPPVPVQAPPMPGPYGAQAAFYPRIDANAGYPNAYVGPPKSRTTAALLAFFLGWLGIHRFYLGHTGTGIAMITMVAFGPCTCYASWLGVGLWAFVDFILVLTGNVREANGRALV